MTNQLCPCGLGDYQNCCAPFHQGLAAPSAEALMRSRYSAYALGHINYLIETTAIKQQPLLDRAAIDQWSLDNQWLELEVLDHQAKLGKNHALVEFRARYRNENQEQLHHEVSYFVYHQERWYFLDPTVNLPTLKQPCICGSDKKFKACCATYLL